MAAVTWDKGGEADVMVADDDKVTLASTIPSAPGSRLDGRVESGSAIRVKVARCKKDESGRFVIEGRLIDATRALRDALVLLASARGASD